MVLVLVNDYEHAKLEKYHISNDFSLNSLNGQEHSLSGAHILYEGIGQKEIFS